VKLEVTFKHRCEAIAVDWRHYFHLRAFDPLPAEQLLQALGGEAITPDQLVNVSSEVISQLLNGSDWSAGLIRRHPLLILCRPDHTPARHQSDMMHEIAHILLKHPLIDFNPETGLPMRDQSYEAEATYLGGCLQIPRLGLRWITQQGFTTKQIANHFTASEGMVRLRANMTGIAVS
jgi:hypothetical protein